MCPSCRRKALIFDWPRRARCKGLGAAGLTQVFVWDVFCGVAGAGGLVRSVGVVCWCICVWDVFGGVAGGLVRSVVCICVWLWYVFCGVAGAGVRVRSVRVVCWCICVWLWDVFCVVAGGRVRSVVCWCICVWLFILRQREGKCVMCVYSTISRKLLDSQDKIIQEIFLGILGSCF